VNRHCLLSVDLEDFHFNLPRDLGLVSHHENPAGVRRGVDRLRRTLQDAPGERHITFFTTGQIARDQPDLVRELAADGHEIGCHTDQHDRVNGMTAEQFETDLRRAMNSISAVSGTAVSGFRAPYFSLTDGEPWALEILARHGFTYDSSLQYGTRRMPGRPFDNLCSPAGELAEFPIYTRSVASGVNVRVIGGTYLRLLPLGVILRLLDDALAAGFTPIVYVHPIDLDPAYGYLPPAAFAPLGVGRPWYWQARQRQWSVGARSATSKLAAILEKFPNAGRMADMVEAARA
jgi:hypothetical protein